MPTTRTCKIIFVQFGLCEIILCKYFFDENVTRRKKRIMVRHFFFKFCISSTDTFFAYRNVSQSFVINHLIKVVDTFQCVCVLSNFQHLNLHLHVLLTLNFELGQFATLLLAPKIKLWRLTYNWLKSETTKNTKQRRT